MKHRYLTLSIGILSMLGVWNANAQSDLSGINLKGAQKVSKAAAGSDTTAVNANVLGYMSHLPSARVRSEHIAPALVGIQQTFGVRDQEGNEYTRNNNEYFSLVPSVCFETPIGTLISGNVREPWRTDSEFMPHQGPFTAFLYEQPRTVTLFGQTSGKHFERLDESGYIRSLGDPQWDLWIYDNGYGAPATRRFELDTTYGNKTGIMVWMVMPDGNSSPDSIRLVCADHQVELQVPTDLMKPAVLPRFADGEIIIGGCFLIPSPDDPVPYRLVGLASLNNKKWYIYYPFASSPDNEADKPKISKNINNIIENETKPKNPLDNVSPGKTGTISPQQEEEFEQLLEQHEEKTGSKAPCGCQGEPCPDHASSGLDPQCDKCKVTKPCRKHNKKFSTKEKPEIKTGKKTFTDTKKP